MGVGGALDGRSLGGEDRCGGIYIHFPYCAHRCSYCDFNIVAPKVVPARVYTDAVLRELAFRAAALNGPARSLYFGGGTPSLWPAEMVAEVVAAAQSAPGLVADAEVTLEANPMEISPSWAQGIQEAGVNRVSVGVQALTNPFLQTVDRRHDLTRALEALDAVRGAGFRSWTFDMMFGLPGQRIEDWRAELDRAIALGAPHLSIYNLTVEPRTILARDVSRGQVVMPPDGAQMAMFFEARTRLQAAGYEHYEVSSYALPGHRAVHNSGYWDGRDYLGIGAGAHGFLNAPEPARWMNIKRPKRYITACMAGEIPVAETDVLDPTTLGFERVMTGLRRLVDGVDVVAAGADWAAFETAIIEQERLGRLRVQGTHIVLTDEGMRWMDAVLMALLPDD